MTPYDLVGCYKPTHFCKNGDCTFLPKVDTYLTKLHGTIIIENIFIFYSLYGPYLFPVLGPN